MTNAHSDEKGFRPCFKQITRFVLTEYQIAGLILLIKVSHILKKLALPVLLSNIFLSQKKNTLFHFDKLFVFIYL